MLKIRPLLSNGSPHPRPLSPEERGDDVADAGALFAACRHSIESASKLIKRAPSTAVRRRGFTITEVIVSVILLGTVIGIVVPLTKRAIDQREQAQIRRAALMELSNTLERLVADPAAGPPPGEQREFPLPDRMASQFDEPRLTVAKVSFDDDVPGHRFDASLTWNAPNGRRSSPIRLSAFAFDSTAERETP